MREWHIVLAAALPAALILALLILLYFYKHTPSESNRGSHALARQKALYAGVLRLRQNSLDSNTRQGNRVASVWRNSYNYNGYSYPLKAFAWNDHPSLIAEAVEHGWATFAFTNTCSTFAPANSSLWDLCSGGCTEERIESEISWEMGTGSDFMQKIRLNPGLPTKKNMNLLPPVQSLQTALPLPGPPLGPLSFPQEAYFEITILAENGEYVAAVQKSVSEDEDVKLISQSFKSEERPLSSESAGTEFTQRVEFDVKKSPRRDSNRLENGIIQHGSKDFRQLNNVQDSSGHPKVISLGLAVGGTPPYRLPGCEPGSVGFHSTGFVFLNGMAHVDGDPEQKPASANRAWGCVNTVIGCGFDPASKKVFYTLNGEQVYSLTCKSDEFGNPLYPTIAANYDVTVMVNFGQSSFEYSAANAQRVPDPCFRRPANSTSKKFPGSSLYEDSADLFSMGRIDSQWLGGTGCSDSQDLQQKRPTSEGESELFEIVLDVTK
eukprot:Gb_17990 [translate_table: standard]